MTDEIERKWLVAGGGDGPGTSGGPGAAELGAGNRMRQGYLAGEDDVEVRLRFSAPGAGAPTGSAVLTVKAGRGLTRTEVEVRLPPADAEALWPHTEGKRVEKVRYRVPLGTLVAEVDRYEGHLQGLWTVEVEFGSEADAGAFEAPAWFGRDLTGVPGWSNRDLARHGLPD